VQVVYHEDNGAERRHVAEQGRKVFEQTQAFVLRVDLAGRREAGHARDQLGQQARQAAPDAHQVLELGVGTVGDVAAQGFDEGLIGQLHVFGAVSPEDGGAAFVGAANTFLHEARLTDAGLARHDSEASGR
jgi:hypothetical protein